MKKFLKLPLYAAMTALFSMGMIACDDDENNNGGTTPDELSPREAALKEIVNDYTKNTVIPTYEALADASVELHTACLEMYNAGVGNVTTDQVKTAGEAWKKAREYWERSEAWLYGPAGDYNVDPHIDSWPLDQNALDALLANESEMAKMDVNGVYISSQDYGLLGFHALEYMLFAIEGSGMNQTSVPHSTDYTAQELSYIAGVAGDLRNHCIFLEAAWVGEDNISSAKKQVLADVRNETQFAANNVSIQRVLEDLANGLCYADEMNNPQEGGGNDFVNYLQAIQSLAGEDGIQNIANEVGNIKIGNPTGMGAGDEYEYDPDYIESPYSLNSINDFLGNIISIENAYKGIQTSKSYNNGITYAQPVEHSLSKYVASLDADLDTRVCNAIDNAYDAINQMQEPFVITCAQGGPYTDINRNAITACRELNGIFDEVLALIREQR